MLDRDTDLIPDAVRQREQADLLDLLMVSDNGYRSFSTTLSKYVLQPLKTKTAAGVIDCLVSRFFDHGSPAILYTDNGMELFNKTLMLRIYEILHYRAHHPQNQELWSGLKETSRRCSTPDSGMLKRSESVGQSYLM